jgi:hypothetical protein
VSESDERRVRVQVDPLNLCSLDDAPSTIASLTLAAVALFFLTAIAFDSPVPGGVFIPVMVRCVLHAR